MGQVLGVRCPHRGFGAQKFARIGQKWHGNDNLLPPLVTPRVTRIPQPSARILERHLIPATIHIRKINPRLITPGYIGLETVIDLGANLADEAIEIENLMHEVYAGFGVSMVLLT